METKYSLTPHPDVELGFERKPIEYFATFPDNGINNDTGLILVIPGWGDRADFEYQKDKLRPYLSNKYNCISVGVNYFGAKLHALAGNESKFQILDSNRFATSVYNMFGISQQDYIIKGVLQLDILSRILAARGIKSLGMEFRLALRNRLDTNEYQSFGFLPAIDHIQVLGEVLEKYKINRKRLIAFGSSYGGYIALLLGKFAPNTFSVIIDNSGFIKSSLPDIATVELGRESGKVNVNGVDYPRVPYSPWTIGDETSPYYFSDSHRCIRNLLLSEHITKTPTKYYIFHSMEDAIVPVKDNDAFCAMLKEREVEVSYKVVNANDIDGRLFKNLNHGMNASLRGIFDFVAGSNGNNFCKAESLTDFDKSSRYIFNCGERAYIFSYNKNYSIKVEITNSASNNYYRYPLTPVTD